MALEFEYQSDSDSGYAGDDEVDLNLCILRHCRISKQHFPITSQHYQSTIETESDSDSEEEQISSHHEDLHSDNSIDVMNSGDLTSTLSRKRENFESMGDGNRNNSTTSNADSSENAEINSNHHHFHLYVDNSAGAMNFGDETSTCKRKRPNYDNSDNAIPANNNDNVDNVVRENGNGNNDYSESANKRPKHFSGVHWYKRTGRWEAYMWCRELKEQLWLGQHFIAEAAARTCDKAQLVLRPESLRRLNYPEQEYDIASIENWRTLDLERFVEVLKNQAHDDSKGCTLGLTETAANQLLQQINEAKQINRVGTQRAEDEELPSIPINAIARNSPV